MIPTRKAVSESWDAYTLLRQAEAKDRTLAADPDYRSAVERAHARWSRAFVAWDGK